MPINPQHGALEMAWDLLAGRYPAFVYRNALDREEAPPIFGYHEADAERLEALLRYLSENDYVTLDCDAYYDHLTGRAPAPTRSVLLTFDDGMGSIWSIAYPLLKKYGHRAVVFAIPGRIRENPPGVRYPTLADVWDGRAEMEEVLARDVSDQPLATWQELREVSDAGVFDVQSHTNLHDAVFTSATITGFLTPAAIEYAHVHDLSMYAIPLEGRSYALPKPGAPLYPADPRMSGMHAVSEDVALRHALEDYAEAEGGRAFFRRTDWERQLRHTVKEHRSRHPFDPEREDDSKRDQALRSDLEKARETIESRIPGHRVRYLALPWGVGSDSAIHAAKRSGYQCVFWGKHRGRLTNKIGGDPFHVVRIGEHFDALLPGQTRRPLVSVLGKKVIRRFWPGCLGPGPAGSPPTR